VWALFVAAGAVAVLPLAACGSGFLRGLTGGQADAGSDAGGEASTCFDPIPERPTGAESPTQRDLTFAVEDIRLDTASRDAGLPAPEGRDLDRTCSCPGPPSCRAPSGWDPACDGPRGQDDAFGPLFNQIASLIGYPDFAAYIRSGGFTTLIDVQQWNGERDDPVVTVALRTSQGLESHADGGTERAKLDGTDVWTVDPSSLIDGEKRIGLSCEATIPTLCLPAYRDANAYVRDGRLYAHLDFPFALTTPQGRLILDMKQVTLIGTLTKVSAAGAESYRLEGELVGRVPASRFLTNVAVLRDTTTGTANCGSSFYPAVKAEICGAVDILSDPSKDGSDAPCDALSGAIRFVAGPARAGVVFAGDKASTECLDFQDSCSN
jgi:hypothetical protein